MGVFGKYHAVKMSICQTVNIHKTRSKSFLFEMISIGFYFKPVFGVEYLLSNSSSDIDFFRFSYMCKYCYLDSKSNSLQTDPISLNLPSITIRNPNQILQMQIQ